MIRIKKSSQHATIITIIIINIITITIIIIIIIRQAGYQHEPQLWSCTRSGDAGHGTEVIGASQTIEGYTLLLGIVCLRAQTGEGLHCSGMSLAKATVDKLLKGYDIRLRPDFG
ncbi:unnamed protein product, partial [Pleuronectes platessa]